MNKESPPSPTVGTPRRLIEILLVAFRLGLTSFGGPVAHLGYFREEYVVARKWLDERSYADLVALCQFLPGPASSQLGIAVGITRGGLLGGVAAWLGFTLPSAALLILFAYGVTEFDDLVTEGWLRGLKTVAVAVVALALWGMAKNLTPDKERVTIAVLSCIALLFWAHPIANIVVIAVAGLVGWRLLRDHTDSVDTPTQKFSIGRWFALTCLAVFLVLLIGTPIIRQAVENDWLNVFDGFYRSGSLVFGGGHVILPLLQAEVVSQGWTTKDQFIAGYGAAQAVPGPLLTFSAYLGTVNGGWTVGLFALGAIFLPSFLLVIGILPFWDNLRSRTNFRAALMGINSAVVGLVGAALYDPVWTTAITSREDLALAAAAFGLLAFWKCPPWLVVLLSAIGGAALLLL
ncbi:MAG: chromate efflux transporter [Dehalococcoidia bacterium]|nr:chromate efflux transporter [Dehalococcoidia bacterium]